MSELCRRGICGTAPVLLSLMLAGCTSNVILLPESDGRPGAVTIRQGEKEILLDRPYAAAQATPFGPRTYQSDQREVDALFAPALAAQPARAATFTLYFVEGKDELTAESQEVVGKILSDVAKRRVPDIVVVGHTDLVGSHPFNDALGQQRADAVRSALIRLGIPATDVRAISRGKREPAVPTADGVAEPLNRRVVILVR